MTLLISAFTKSNAIIASDRRLAFVNESGAVVPGNDDACKLIIYDGQFVFAYTGPAILGGMKTDIWITNTLLYAEENWNIVDAIRHLAMKAKEEISKYRYEKMKYFTVICVGWQSFGGSSELRPAFGHVSTYLDKNLAQVPLREVEGSTCIHWSFRRIYKGQLPFVVTAGQNISKNRLIALKRNFRKFSTKDVSQDLAIDALYEEIIHASNNNAGKGWIGKGVLAAAISSQSVDRENRIITHGNWGTGQQFIYYPANSRKKILKGPHAVQPGRMTLTNFRGFSNIESSKKTPKVPDQVWHMPWTRIQ